MVAEKETEMPEQKPEGQDEPAPEKAVEATVEIEGDVAAAEAEAAEATAETEPAKAAETEEAEETTDNADSVEDDSPESLAALLQDAQAKVSEHWDQLLRVRAEMENLKRRQANELEKAHKFALDGFVRELLQVRDSLELGRDAARDEQADIAKVREGTELTLKLLEDVMGKFGVEQVNPQGEPFDPEYHQAMTMQPAEDVAPNTVITVVQKGYLLNGRLVRPAMVMVAAEPESEQA